MRIWLVVANGKDSPTRAERDKPGETEVMALATPRGCPGVECQAVLSACCAQQQQGHLPV